MNKKIFICWDDKNIIENESPLIKNGLKNLVDLNPDWDLEISNKKEVSDYLKKSLSKNDYENIKNTHIVEKCDLWRLFKLYNEGGLYIDIDRFCNTPLSDILDDNTMCVLPTCLDYDFSQDFMLSSPQNPIYLNTIELILKRRREGHKNTYFLGAQTYMHSVTEMLCGEMIDTNPKIEIFEKIREKIKKFTFIKTYRESPPHDTIVYRNGNKKMNWEKMKRDLYGSYGIRHWTDSW